MESKGVLHVPEGRGVRARLSFSLTVCVERLKEEVGVVTVRGRHAQLVQRLMEKATVDSPPRLASLIFEDLDQVGRGPGALVSDVEPRLLGIVGFVNEVVGADDAVRGGALQRMRVPWEAPGPRPRLIARRRMLLVGILGIKKAEDMSPAFDYSGRHPRL